MCGFLEIGKWQITFQKKLDWFDLQSIENCRWILNVSNMFNKFLD